MSVATAKATIAATSNPELSPIGNLARLIEGVRSSVQIYAADYAFDAPDAEIDETNDTAHMALIRSIGEYLLAAESIEDLDIDVALKRLGVADRITAVA